MSKCVCPLGESIGCLINVTARATQNYLTRRLSERGLDITVEQFKVMMYLWRHTQPTQQEIADFIGKDKTSITRLLGGLEKRGLISRVQCPTDKRNNRVIITPLGSQLETPVREVVDQATYEIDQTFSQEDLETTKRVLRQLCGMIDMTMQDMV